VVLSIQYGLKLPWTSRPAPYRARRLFVPASWAAWTRYKVAAMTARGSLRRLSRAEAWSAPWVANAFVTNLRDAPRLFIN